MNDENLNNNNQNSENNPSTSQNPPQQPSSVQYQQTPPTGNQQFGNSIQSIPTQNVTMYGAYQPQYGMPQQQPKKSSYLALWITLGVLGFIVFSFVLVFAVGLVGYSAEQNSKNNSSSTSKSNTNSNSLSETKGSTPCYTYDIPKGYVVQKETTDCQISLNINAKADALTQISIQKVTVNRDVASAQLNLRNTLGDSLVDVNDTSLSSGYPAAVATLRDAYKLKVVTYYIYDSLGAHKDNEGSTIWAYTVTGYAYNSSLSEQVRAVADSFRFK